jgi:vacuolar-type H+-ATPase subunit I/STV1
MQHLTRHIGIVMPDDLARSAKEEIEAVRRNRERLAQQIRKSQETIARSQELLRRIDDMLAKAGQKPRS